MDINALLKSKNLRATKARIAVLHALNQSKMPQSHNDVAETLKSTEFDRATIFRNLVDMAEAGILHRIDVGDHVWRFELKDLESHSHFVCNDCGDVACLPEVNLSPQVEEVASKFKVRQISEVLLKGHCEDCT
jgi:Fur family ferric uptake transcriptional regulator